MGKIIKNSHITTLIVLSMVCGVKSFAQVDVDSANYNLIFKKVDKGCILLPSCKFMHSSKYNVFAHYSQKKYKIDSQCAIDSCLITEDSLLVYCKRDDICFIIDTATNNYYVEMSGRYNLRKSFTLEMTLDKVATSNILILEASTNRYYFRKMSDLTYSFFKAQNIDYDIDYIKSNMRFSYGEIR